jgi:hypothetical protein
MIYMICIIVGLLIAGVPLGILLRRRVSINEEIRQLNNEEESKYQKLLIQKESVERELLSAKSQYECTVKLAEEAADALAKASMEKAMAGVESSLEQLGQKYREIEQDYDNEYHKLMADLVQDMNKTMEIKRQQISELETERSKLAASIEASIKARVKEKEIKEQLDFYCLKVDPLDLNDIVTLEKVKSRLSKPRILSMLIWQTYYQKAMTQLCNDVLGTNVVTGIYKITNQTTDQVYIGQARDVAARWKEHAKCGLDIDRPAGNKLYQAMMEDGLVNFSWELLEKCSSAELNEKEKYYIEIYQACEFGYNSNKGNSKKG